MKIPDWRHIKNGNVIPTYAYSDQPYIVIADDGAWVCTTTTGIGVEGAVGECVVVSRSTDYGENWSMPLKIDYDDTDYAYAVPAKAPNGRLYCFYNHNTDRVRQADLFGKRCDMGGHFVFKYSSDNGITWSANRYEIPVREFEIDRRNPVVINSKEYRFFWTVGKPFFDEGIFYLPLIKFNFDKVSLIGNSECVIMMSPNLATEKNPDKILWETLPDGDVGIRTPEFGGPIAEEHSIVALSDGSFFCVFRTIDGRGAFTYSRDKGRTWDPPQYMPFKNPRAANVVWKCKNGRYLYWFHNHGLRWYTDRNPVWLSCAHEADSPDGKVLEWSQPEIVLYCDSEYALISYPDMVEDNGRIYLTETQKETARVHEIPDSYLDTLIKQETLNSEITEGLIFDASAGTASLPVLPKFSDKDLTATDFAKLDLRNGITFDIVCDSTDAILFENVDDMDKGVLIEVVDGFVCISFSDGRTKHLWDSNPNKLTPGKTSHIGIVIDGGPKILSIIINGVLCDGGDARDFGWCRFSPQLIDLNGNTGIFIHDSVKRLRVYNRALMTSEIISNYRHQLT